MGLFLSSLYILICWSYPFSGFKCQLYVSDSKISSSSSDLSAELPVCMSSYLFDISTWGLIDNIKLGMFQTVDSPPTQAPILLSPHYSLSYWWSTVYFHLAKVKIILWSWIPLFLSKCTFKHRIISLLCLQNLSWIWWTPLPLILP